MSLLGPGIVASRVSLTSISRRLGLALVIVACMACVIGVSLSMFSLTEGLARAFSAGGDDRHAIVTGADNGGIDRASAATVLEAPGIAPWLDGKPLASFEAIQYLPPPQGFSEGTLFLRGITPSWPAITSGFRIVSGRMFQSGRQELIVGKGAESMFGLKVGGSVILPNGEWPIVGEFTANGSYVESELLGDVETVMTVGRISKYATVVMTLEDPKAFVRLKSWLTSNPSLSVSAERQSEFLARTAGRYTKFFTTIAYLVASMMGVGALFGSVQIMYASVEARTREIGILRAIGYGPGSLAVTVLLEIVALADRRARRRNCCRAPLRSDAGDFGRHSISVARLRANDRSWVCGGGTPGSGRRYVTRDPGGPPPCGAGRPCVTSVTFTTVVEARSVGGAYGRSDLFYSDFEAAQRPTDSA